MTIRKLGKYEIAERLGRGGMAEVFKAYHASLDRHVAIKVLHPFLADDEEFASRFGREAQNIARLKHPHIVQVYDYEYDETTESYYMVMELINGDTLKDRLLRTDASGKRISLEEALRIIREAASALSYAHRAGMIHRDVKPANLLLDSEENDRVVLTDFGIAKIVKGPQFTMTGGLVGTPAYMAPEQGMGETGDERSDLYSLGVIFYQMVTGQLPYDAETPLALILRHMNDPIPSMRNINWRIPEPVDLVARKLMAKSPDNRYTSADQLIQDIRQVEESLYQNGSEATPIQLTAAVAKVDDGLDSPTIPFNQLGSRRKDDTQRLPPVVKTATPDKRRFSPGCLLVGILFIMTALLGGGYIAGAQSGAFPAVGFLASPTPTNTPTDLPTETPSPTVMPTDTPAPTATGTATSTITPTSTATAMPTNTPTEVPFTDTPNPPTMTPNATQTAIVERTATFAACIFDYEVIEQEPRDGIEGGFFTVNSPYLRRISLLNTGTCAWERNTSIAFIEGEDFNAGPRIFIRETVEVGEEVEVLFQGVLPTAGSLQPIAGRWQLRTPGQLAIGDPFIISIQVYDPGPGN